MVPSMVSVKIEKDLQVFISFLFLISVLHSISISFLLIYYRRKSKMRNEEAFIIFRHRQFIYVRTYIKYVKNKNFYKQNIIYPSKTTLCKMEKKPQVFELSFDRWISAIRSCKCRICRKFLQLLQIHKHSNDFQYFLSILHFLGNRQTF